MDANTVAVNFVWTLVCGFLVMFMQAGFALVETGFTRAKNAAHTMTMNFMVYGIAMLAYWAVGFALQAGGVGPLGTLGGYDQLSHEVSVTIAGKAWGLFGGTGFFLTGVAYTAPGFAYFLFQMVFMDTTATIPTGALAERWKFSAFAVFSVFIGAIIYPIYANWTWGGGWLAMLGKNLGLGRPRRLRGIVGCAHDGWGHGVRHREAAGPAAGEVQRQRDRERHPGAQHPDGAGRHVHPRVRMVRLQRRLDVGGLPPAHRCHRDEHDAGGGGGGGGGRSLSVGL